MGTLPRYMICVYLASAKWMSTPPYSTKLWQFYAFLITWGLFLVVTPELKFTSCDQFMASLSAAMILRILYIPAGLSACIWGHFGPERKDTRWWVGGWVGGGVCGLWWRLSFLSNDIICSTIANSNDPSASIRKNVQKMQPFFISLYYIWVYFEGDGDIIKHNYIGSATVTTRITFLVGNPNEPSFATATGWGIVPTYIYIYIHIHLLCGFYGCHDIPCKTWCYELCETKWHQNGEGGRIH